MVLSAAWLHVIPSFQIHNSAKYARREAHLESTKSVKTGARLSKVIVHLDTQNTTGSNRSSCCRKALGTWTRYDINRLMANAVTLIVEPRADFFNAPSTESLYIMGFPLFINGISAFVVR